jgi:hypothetical protein
MNPDDISRLSRKLLSTSLASEGVVSLGSVDFRDELQVVDEPLRTAVETFIEEIRAAIPSDFNFSLSFDREGVGITLEFDDGNTGVFGVDRYYAISRKSLRRRLREAPWDDIRAQCIQQEGVFDDLLSAADDRPPNIPSSEEAAARYGRKLSDQVARVRELLPLPNFTLIIARDDLGIDVQHIDDRAELIGVVADRMTTQNDILAVLERGVAWPFVEIEKAKQEAVEKLLPISRAKAERRFN